MTIAMCYLSPEGIVLGADSTSSGISADGQLHYFNHNQKLFQIGEKGSCAILTWGLGSLGDNSYRTLIATLSDDLDKNPPKDFAELANRWTDHFWSAYKSDQAILPLATECERLSKLLAYDPNVAAYAAMRTIEEEKQFSQLLNTLYVGFCIAGYVLPSRAPAAFQVHFQALKPKPVPIAVILNGYAFWGAPNMIKRLIWGRDDDLQRSIIASGKWSGTEADLKLLLDEKHLGHALLPIRDAIDFVHTCIYSTIKAMKFSQNAQICGGPIELAVITTDRPFRWVRHKEWDAAIMEGGRIG